jgi:4-amino-4-deoxychorismate lyase
MNMQRTYIINGGLDHGVSPFDRGLSYGDGVFRTFKVIEGLPVDWPLHYQRLVSDCGAIGIVCPSAEVLIGDIQSLFSPNDSAVAKFIITRGEGERGYAAPAVTMPTRILIKSELPTYAASNYATGVQLYTCKTTLSFQTALAGVKHLNRLENVLARAEWNDPTFFDGVMLDMESNVIECTSANIFARYDKELHTPSVDRCGIAGVTRQRIINLAHLPKLKPIVKNITLPELLDADEVFICNSIYGAIQVRTIAQKHWAMGDLATRIREILVPL